MSDDSSVTVMIVTESQVDPSPHTNSSPPTITINADQLKPQEPRDACK